MVKYLKLGYKYVLVTAYALVISDLLTLAKDAAIDYVFRHRFSTVVDTLAEERREAEREVEQEDAPPEPEKTEVE